MLLLWLGANLLSGILSNPFEAPEAARTVGAVAPISLIAALPLYALCQVVCDWARTRPGGVNAPCRATRAGQPSPLIDRAGLLAGIVAAGVVGIAGTLTVRDYFAVYAVNPAAWQAMHGPMTLVGRAVPAFIRQGYKVRVDPDLLPIAPIYRFLTGATPQAYNPARPVSQPVAAPGLVLVVPSSDLSLLAELRRDRPGATVRRLAPTFNPKVAGYSLVIISAPVTRTAAAGPRPSWGGAALVTP